MNSAIETATMAFRTTLSELWREEANEAVEDAAQLGERAALLASATTLWQRHVGPFISVRQAQELLQVHSRQAVHDLIQRGRLLACVGEHGEPHIPLFQFGPNGRPHEAVPAVMAIFKDIASPWTIASWLTSPCADLQGEIPIEWTKQSKSPALLLEAAKVAAAPLRW